MKSVWINHQHILRFHSVTVYIRTQKHPGKRPSSETSSVYPDDLLFTAASANLISVGRKVQPHRDPNNSKTTDEECTDVSPTHVCYQWKNCCSNCISYIFLILSHSPLILQGKENEAQAERAKAVGTMRNY